MNYIDSINDGVKILLLFIDNNDVNKLYYNLKLNIDLLFNTHRILLLVYNDVKEDLDRILLKNTKHYIYYYEDKKLFHYKIGIFLNKIKELDVDKQKIKYFVNFKNNTFNNNLDINYIIND